MLNPFRRFVVSFELEQLSVMIGSARSILERQPPGYASLAHKHIERAVEQHQDALVALKYNNLGQAENLLKDGLSDAYFAFRLANAISRTTLKSGPEPPSKLTEAEKSIAYLGSTLTDLKGTIEYGHLLVTDLAQQQIQKAMDLYDKALAALKNDNQLVAKRAAQSGVLQLAFAGEVVKSENGGMLLGQIGLANILTNSPLRKMNRLAASIIQVYLVSQQQQPDALSVVSSRLQKAIQNLNGAIEALAEDNTVYAQALVVTGLEEVEAAQVLLEPHINDRLLEDERETTRLRQKFSAANVEIVVVNIRNILEHYSSRLPDKVGHCLDLLLKHHESARKSMEMGDASEAKRLVHAGLRDVERIRKLLFKDDGTLLLQPSDHF